MDIIIALISIDVIASKFLRCYIASYRFPQETKSLTQKLLKQFGLENEIWLPFFCTVLLVGACVYLLNSFYASFPFQLLYVVGGLFTMVLNLGAAHSNYFGRTNFITEKLLR